MANQKEYNMRPLFQDVTKQAAKEVKQVKKENSFTYDGIDKEGLAFSKGMVITSLFCYFFIVIVIIFFAYQLVCSTPADGQMASGSIQGLSSLSAALGAIATGATILPCTVCVSYYKKTQLPHAAKVEADLYKSVLSLQLSYNKEMMKAQAQYKLTDAEVNKIENQSKAKTISDGVFNDANTVVKNHMNDLTALAKKETGA